jgi:hypothetical protein
VAILGWRTTEVPERYTQAADRNRLVNNATALAGGAEKRTNVSPLGYTVRSSGKKPSKKPKKINGLIL